jgi:hypothetical protein
MPCQIDCFSQKHELTAGLLIFCHVGQTKVFLGRANEAAEHTLKAIQLSPRDSELARWCYRGCACPVRAG